MSLRDTVGGMLQALAMVALLAWVPVDADTITLKNGNKITGKILDEKPDQIRISTGISEMVIPTTAVEKVEREVSAQFLQQRGERALRQAQDLQAQGRNSEANQLLQNAIRDIEAEAGKIEGGTPEELKLVLGRLEAARQQTIPRDGAQMRAEELYKEALRHLDHVDYAKAFESLRKSVEEDPDRGDVHLLLAETALKVKQTDAAIAAYRQTLRIDPESFYQTSSAPLLGLLQQRGKELLAVRKADEALEFYKEALLLEGADKGKPADIGTFLARRATRERQSEDVVLMEVYRYADDNDLIDLAFAAVSRVERLRPDDPEVRKLARETGFLNSLKEKMAAGRADEAAKLIAETPEDVVNSPNVTEKMTVISGALDVEVQAETLLIRARKALADSQYAEAEELARKIVTEYSKTKSSSEAATILRTAQVEAPIKEIVDRANAAIEDEDYDRALSLLAGLRTQKGVETSRHIAEIEEMIARVPMEKEARDKWTLASAHLDREEFDQALGVLEELSSKYGNTKAGRRASEWLSDYRKRLQREANRERLIDQSYYSFFDSNLWKAASSPVPGARPQAASMPEEARGRAWATFEEVEAREIDAQVDTRSRTMYVGVPLLVGGLLLFGFLWHVARPGSGQYVELDELDAESSGTYEPRVDECRLCGQVMPESELVCAACGASRRMSDVEVERAVDHKRKADYDPWKERVRAAVDNRYEEFYQKARDLSETSDVQAAIENCRQALHEDPHRKEGYRLLAELYERIGQHEEAAVCYREILLIDPSEVTIRQKMETKQALAEQPIKLGLLPVVLSGLTWWMVFWLLQGVDPQAWVLRVALCVAAAALTVLFWHAVQRRSRHSYIAKGSNLPDKHRPLPRHDLSWKEQNRQARLLSSLITEHTHIEVPRLTTSRLWWAIGLSFLLLAALVALAWLNNAPWVLLAWPAGATLFFYYLEIHPRVEIAHVLLRHVFEETSSPWVDPHLPFEPKALKGKVAGDFLIRSPNELPVRWALNPVPYGATRQAVLNSIQQTLNRHWDCHHFYNALHVVRDVDFPMPGGFRAMFGVALIAVLFCLGSIYQITSSRARAEKFYRDDMRIGYQYLLNGEAELAVDAFERAQRVKPANVAPNLYLGHAYATLGFSTAAERAFQNATRSPLHLSAAHNDFGNFLQREGRLKEAVVEYKAALDADERNANILNNLGSALYKLRIHDQAKGYLNQAVGLNPTHSRAWTTLGLTLEELGEKAAARQAYESAVRVAPDEPYTQIARDRLEADLRGDDAPLALEVATGSE